MSNNDKIAGLFVDFVRNGSLESLAEAIKITEDVLENSGNVRDKEIAKNRFKAYKNEQSAKARRILEEEDDFRKVKKCREALDEFYEAKLANSSEDLAELGKVKDELSKKEVLCLKTTKNTPEYKEEQVKYKLESSTHDKILLRKAKEHGIIVTEAEIDEYIKSREGRT